MTGYIRKYYADISDRYLCDDGTLADPDFLTNKRNDENAIPTWAICGPYLRMKLTKNDVVLFVPVIERLRQIGLDNYICTGILVVDRILPKKTEVLKHPVLNAKFKRLYSLDLARHLKKDMPSTKKIRSKNIILGHRSQSTWFGRNSVDLSHALKTLGMTDVSKQLANRQIRQLSRGETIRLQHYLRSKLSPIQDREHGHWNRRTEGGCKTCYRN